jgi:uracil-DNA glycosylase
MKSKKKLIEKLYDSLAQDKSLPLLESSLVLGEGSLSAQVFFIGEAPGLNEDREKRPFVGRSGKLLRLNIQEIGLKEDDFYISNIVKRRPPDNRDPKKEEIKAYLPYLKKEIEIIDPVLVVLLGRFSANCFFSDIKISRDQGQLFNLHSRFFIPVLHPAASFRSRKNKEGFIDSFQKIKHFLEEKEKYLP